METITLHRHFRRIGAQLDVNIVPERHRVRGRLTVNDQFVIDIRTLKGDERFEIRIREDVCDAIELTPLNVRPDLRHLLLMFKRPDLGDMEKFLCGHDERHWFVSSVNPATTHVMDALESLKPAQAQVSQRKHRVRTKNRHRRKNAGFVRQGEWFFLPEPRFEPFDNGLILAHEPLARPGGKPHMIDELYRTGGEKVYVSRTYPRGVSEKRYRRLIRRNTAAARANWTVMRRNPQVYGRGRVRHPDHATIVLPFWHRVVMSREAPSVQVAFLD